MKLKVDFSESRGGGWALSSRLKYSGDCKRSSLVTEKFISAYWAGLTEMSIVQVTNRFSRVFCFLFIDLQKMRDPGAMAERRDDFEENEDFGDEEDILDLRVPKESGAQRGSGGKQTGKKRNRARRGRDKTRFRQS